MSADNRIEGSAEDACRVARQEAREAVDEYVDALAFNRPIDAHRLATALQALLAFADRSE